MLHLEALTPESHKLFPLLEHFKEDFYLAGGTALALQIGHRVSVDFDLFSAEPIVRTLSKKIDEVYASGPIEILVNNSRELTFLAQEVKHTFLHYPFPLILPMVQNELINLLAPKEILATKAYTIGRRGSLKDYIDLYIGIQEGVAMLVEIIDLARTKYSEAFNDRLFLEQLLYLDDVSEERIILLSREVPTKQDLTSFFTKEIAKLSL